MKNELWLKAECLQPYELLSRKRLNMNYSPKANVIYTENMPVE